MSAHDLFVRFGLSKRLVDDFLRPTLLVGLSAPRELSAAVTMELLYFYALAHQTSSMSSGCASSGFQSVISPLAERLRESIPVNSQNGASRVTRVNVT